MEACPGEQWWRVFVGCTGEQGLQPPLFRDGWKGRAASDRFRFGKWRGPCDGLDISTELWLHVKLTRVWREFRSGSEQGWGARTEQ